MGHERTHQRGGSGRFGIRAYLWCALSLLAGVPVLTLGWWGVQRTAEATRAHMDEAGAVTAAAAAEDIVQVLHERASDVEQLAAAAEVLGLTDRAPLQRLLGAFRARAQAFAMMYVADASGRSLVVDPPRDAQGRSNAGTDYSDRDYVVAMRRSGSVSLSKAQLGRRSKAPAIQIAAPIRLAGVLAGFAEGSVSLRQLDRDFQHGTMPQLVVVDELGRVVLDRSRRRPPLSDVSQQALFRPAKAWRPRLRSRVDERGQLMRASVVDVRPDRSGRVWTVVAYRPESDVQLAAWAARRHVLLVTSGALLIALAVASLLALVMSRPIRQLAQVTGAVGRGEVTQLPQAAAWRPRELVELFAATQEMLDKLREHRRVLEVQVERRTQELAAANVRLRPLAAALEQLVDAIVVCDAAGVIQHTNPAFTELTGHRAEEVRGRRLAEVLLGFDASAPAAEAVLEQVRAGEPWRGEQLARRKDGEAYDQDVTVSPVYDEQQRLVNIVVIKRDISARRRAEEALRVSDRLASVGALAGGVAHEINNPLAYVAANLEVLREDFERLPGGLVGDTAQMLDEMRVGVGRVAEIVKGLKAFSRPDETTVGPVDVHAVLDSCLRMAGNEIRHRARVVRAYGARGLVTCNEAQLAQVFLNLIVNAAQAMKEGGAEANTLGVRTDLEQRPGCLTVEISDTGQGIAPAHLKRIFDPFFTTKPIGEGTGLGLSICHGLVASLGGAITVESELGVGTSFKVHVPAQASPEAAPAVEARVPTEVARVLVIDDEPAVGRAMRRLLRRHDVELAESGAEGLERFDRQAFDVVFCDVMMPEMTGIDVHRQLTERGAQQKVVFISGGAFTSETREFLERCGNICLDKPFSSEALERAIGSVLGRRALS